VEDFSMRSGSRAVTLFVGFFLAVSTMVLAQSATTSLRGTVYDPKGAVVSGASVVLTDPATAFTRRTKTDSQGNYQFLELPPATYELAVSASGFANVKQTGLELMVASPSSANVTMQVAGGTITVEVSGTAPLVTRSLTFLSRGVIQRAFSACRREWCSLATAPISPATRIAVAVL
jgi:hypothetical protein